MKIPMMTTSELRALLPAAAALDSVFIVGIRGFFNPGANKLGIYDDALFVCAPNVKVAFNANTDPSRARKGKGKGAGKGMAHLKPGYYRAHRLGLHRGKYTALVQTGAPVTVVRDGTPNYEDTGYFGINIHRGGVNTTSSLGCQTIEPKQWDAFIALVKKVMKDNKQSVMPYLLVDAKVKTPSGFNELA